MFEHVKHFLVFGTFTRKTKNGLISCCFTNLIFLDKGAGVDKDTLIGYPMKKQHTISDLHDHLVQH